MPALRVGSRTDGYGDGSPAGTRNRLIILTEIAARQGHLPQVAVFPEYQRQGLGRLLVNYGLSRLAELGFDTPSLIVSRLNRPALKVYQVMGFQSVLSFHLGEVSQIHNVASRICCRGEDEVKPRPHRFTAVDYSYEQIPSK